VKLGVRYLCPKCEEPYKCRSDAEDCCAPEAEEIDWCEDCARPMKDCDCLADAPLISLNYDHPFNGRLVVLRELEDPGWKEVGVFDPQLGIVPRCFTVAVHESEISQ
jgi:hypothetical protein